jgi:hypothetical protein
MPRHDPRPAKITFRELRATGVRGVLVYCTDHKCSHSVAMDADIWPDDLRLSDIEGRFVCQACGKRDCSAIFFKPLVQSVVRRTCGTGFFGNLAERVEPPKNRASEWIACH